ncbi:MAG: hypothetical protein LBQ83_02435 [Candidatus Margulisbacteria bacterium]|jgi:hypothetical protein|nr:hypothetical protein [Candidatus Margulisiibacteriota bacterium]
MAKKLIATIDSDIVQNLILALNKVSCATQAVRPGAVPAGVPLAEARRFFKEAIFSLADAQSMQDFIWQEIAAGNNIHIKEITKLYVDFNTRELYIEESKLNDTGN